MATKSDNPKKQEMIPLAQVDQWVSSVSHEIKNPLTAVKLATALLKRKEINSDSATALLNSIENSVITMEKTIYDMMDLASMQEGKFSVKKEWVDSTKLGTNLLASQADFALETGNTLKINLTGQIYCDALRLNQVLVNLTNNALKFTKNGTISVFGESRPSGYHLTVTDSGEGISRKDLPKIFDRFWQTDGAKKKLGLGLGLAIVKGITESHQGKLTVKSKIGSGTCFILDFPHEITKTVTPVPVKIRKSVWNSWIPTQMVIKGFNLRKST